MKKKKKETMKKRLNLITLLMNLEELLIISIANSIMKKIS